MKKDRLSVSEHFYSIQGEGFTAGVPALFLRLGGCNLMCGGKGTEQDKKLHDGATWRCDTIEVWMQSQSMLIQDLYDELDKKYDLVKLSKLGAHLIITGGEPLLQKEGIVSLLHLFQEHRILMPVECETNGTVLPGLELKTFINFWNVSPKLANSGMDKESRFKPSLLQLFDQFRTCFKFVVCNEDDVREVERLIYDAKLNPLKVWLMPGASTTEQLVALQKDIIEACKRTGFRFSNRLQVQVYNQTTGV